MIIIYNTTINGDTECTVVAGEFEGDNSLRRNEIRVHRTMQHALGSNISHCKHHPYK